MDPHGRAHHHTGRPDVGCPLSIWGRSAWGVMSVVRGIPGLCRAQNPVLLEQPADTTQQPPEPTYRPGAPPIHDKCMAGCRPFAGEAPH